MSIDIIIASYNQELFIEQALESILCQDFPDGCEVRILIGDDCSSDSTLSIIEEWEKKSPWKLEYLTDEHNLGITRNYQRCFRNTIADFVFILEGDDYWLPGHIRQHINFFYEHLDCSMVMNRFNLLVEKSDGSYDIVPQTWWHSVSPCFVDLHTQIEKGNQLGNLSACSFRGSLLRNISPEFYKLSIADWELGIELAQHGDIAILELVTSMYRIKSNGVWAGMSRNKQKGKQFVESFAIDRYQHYKYHLSWIKFRHRLLGLPENPKSLFPKALRLRIKKIFKKCQLLK